MEVKNIVTKGRLAFFALLAALLAAGCSKDDGEEQRPPLANISELVPFLEQHRPAVQVYQVQAQGPATLTGNLGTVLHLPVNSLQLPGGAAASGQAEVEMLELFERGDMILWQVPSVSNIRLLATAGQLYLRARQGNTSLRFVNATLQLPLADSLPFQNTLLVYKGSQSGNSVFNWTRPLNSDSSAVSFVPADSLGAFDAYYRVSLPQDTLGWIGISQQFNQTGPGRAVNGKLQGLDNYDGFIVYCVYETVRGVSPFSTHVNGEIYSITSVPDGLPVKLVAIGKQQGRYYFGSSSFTTGPTQSAPEFGVQEVSEMELLAEIEAL